VELYLHFPIRFYDVYMRNYTLLSIWIILVHALTACCFKIHLISSHSLLVLPSCCIVSGIPTKPSVHSVLYTCCMPGPSLPHLILLTIYAEQCRSVTSALYSSLRGCVPEYLECSHDMSTSLPALQPPFPPFNFLSTWSREKATVVGGTHHEVLR